MHYPLTLLFCLFQVSNFFIAQGQPGQRVMGVMNCFGGGIFFGSYLLHMAPEVRMLLEISWLKPKNINYPFPELFMGLGFFLVLYLEKLCKAVNKDVEEEEEEGEEEAKKLKDVEKEEGDDVKKGVDEERRDVVEKEISWLKLQHVEKEGEDVKIKKEEKGGG